MLRAMTLLALLVVLGLAGCQRTEKPQPAKVEAPIEVRVATVESRPRQAVEGVVGSVRSKQRAAVEAKVSAKIERMNVVPGQLVKAGDVLVQLDARELQAKLDQAVAVRDQAQQELGRATGLINNKTISQQEFDLARSRERVAAAAAAEGETQLGYTRITAPFNGVVTRKLAEVGELAVPGKMLLELEDPSALRFETDIPEALIERVHMEEKYAVEIPALKENLEASCSELTPVADQNSRTFLVKFDLPSVTGLRLGQFGRVLIPVGEGAALRVPASAVVRRGQMELVFTVKDNRAQLRLIRTGKRIGEEVEVISGVVTNEQVVTERAGELRDAQAVKVR